MTTTAITAREHLAALERGVDAVSDAVTRLVRPLDDAQLLWRPTPERWGVADCFEHLIAVGAAYHPRVRAAIDAHRRAGRGASADAPYRPTLFGRWFVRGAGPDAAVRIRARGPFIPPPAAASAPRRFLAQQPELRTLIADARGADLRAIKIHAPLNRLLTLRLGECLEMLVAHQWRHVKQAQRVAADAAFPGTR
jgi:hypothetical protein